MNRRLPVLTGVLLVAAIVVGITVAWRRSVGSTESARPDVCDRIAISAFTGPPGSVSAAVTGPEPQPPPGWSVVRIEGRRSPSVMWRFVNDFLAAPDGERMEGVDQPGVALDFVETVRRVPAGQTGNRTRQVILPGKAWIEEAATQARTTCDLESGRRPANLLLGGPAEGWGIPERPVGSAFPDPFFIYWPIAREIGQRQQNGETLTLYELQSDPGMEHLRSEFALDANRQLRFHEVKDTRSGEVVLFRQADPVPGHPPIADPTGQPIIAME